MSRSGPDSFGWNDEDGTVHCGFCDWTKQCQHLEQIEHELRQHVQQEHGKTVLYRVDDETLDRVDIPN